MQVVSQLEIQLQKERDRLTAMMHHLHVAKQMASPEPPKSSESSVSVCWDHVTSIYGNLDFRVSCVNFLIFVIFKSTPSSMRSRKGFSEVEQSDCQQ